MNYFSLLFQSASRLHRARRIKCLVNHRYRFVYVPIPKVATTSMKAFLAPCFDVVDTDKPHLSLEESFITLPEYDSLSEYFSFTIARDPYDRIESAYRDKIVKHSAKFGFVHPGFLRYNRLSGIKLFTPTMSFPRFVAVIRRIPDFMSDEHFRSQTAMLPTRKHKPLLDYIGDFGKIDESVAHISERIGISGSSFPYRNRTEAQAVSIEQPEIPPDTQRSIRARYVRDFDMLGYTR